jgi:hypothetical protein
LAHHLSLAANALTATLSSYTKQTIERLAPNFGVGDATSSTSRPNKCKAMENTVVFRVMARAFATLLVGLSELSVLPNSAVLCGNVIYHLVLIFKEALNLIDYTATTLTKADAGKAGKRGVTSKVSAKSKSKKSSKPIIIMEDISKLLCEFMSQLNSADSYHRELFEGFTHVLFETVGRRLYTATFSRNREATIEEEINVGLPEATVAERKSAAKIFQLEVPCLVSILENAMMLAPLHLSHYSTTSTVKSKKGSSNIKARSKCQRNGGKASFAPSAKDRLQQTLIKCIFGETKEDEMLDYLKMPYPPKNTPKIQEIEEDQATEWFKQEVWRLVGWEILAKEGNF